MCRTCPSMKSMWSTSSLCLARDLQSDCALRVAGTPCRWLVALMWRLWHTGRSRIQIHTTPPTREPWCIWRLIQRRGTLPSLCGSSPPVAGSRQSIAMLHGNTWLSSAAMQHFRTATVFSCPQIRTVTHGGPVRCKRHRMPRVLAPSHGCLRFHTFHSKRMSSECVGTSNPPPPLDETGVPHVGGNFPCFARRVVLWCAA